MRIMMSVDKITFLKMAPVSERETRTHKGGEAAGIHGCFHLEKAGTLVST